MGELTLDHRGKEIREKRSFASKDPLEEKSSNKVLNMARNYTRKVLDLDYISLYELDICLRGFTLSENEKELEEKIKKVKETIERAKSEHWERNKREEELIKIFFKG